MATVMTQPDNLVQSTFRRYLKMSLWIIVGLALIVLALMSICYNPSLLNALIVTVLFSMFSSITYGLAWKRIVRSSPSALTKFFLAAPAVRMIVAAIVMGVWCYIVREPSAIKSFVLLFFAFYLILLVFDCVFFARQEKRNK